MSGAVINVEVVSNTRVSTKPWALKREMNSGKYRTACSSGLAASLFAIEQRFRV